MGEPAFVRLKLWWVGEPAPLDIIVICCCCCYCMPEAAGLCHLVKLCALPLVVWGGEVASCTLAGLRRLIAAADDFEF